MSIHKLSPGDGYAYLSRQVAANGATMPRAVSAPTTPNAETPGVWLGSGLVGLGIEAGSRVSEEQMLLLFGKGLHPITGELIGTPFPDAPAHALNSASRWPRTCDRGRRNRAVSRFRLRSAP